MKQEEEKTDFGPKNAPATRLFRASSFFDLKTLDPGNFQPYPLGMVQHQDKENLFTSNLSTFDLLHFQLTPSGIKPLVYAKKAHAGRINQLNTYKNLAVSCSSDRKVRLWDFRQGAKPVGVLKSKDEEIYSVDICGDALVGGVRENLLFWYCHAHDLSGT
jgi:WD40 repeat protein